MRVWVAGVVALLGGAAWAQPVVDGKATTDGAVGPLVESYINSASDLSASTVKLRAIMGVMTSKGLSADDQDLLRELAAGQAVDVSHGVKTFRVPPLQGEVLAIAHLMTNVPNLNTLWKQPGDPILQMIELSRWGEKPKNRIIGYMANKLYASWAASTINNAYSSFVQEFAGVNNALGGIADNAVKREGKLLLKAAMEQVFAKCVDAGTPLPLAYLYNFAFYDVGDPRQPL